MVLHLDDGVRYALFGHLVSDHTFDASVNLRERERETAQRLRWCGVADGTSPFSAQTSGAAG